MSDQNPSDETLVQFIEEWQSGFLLVIGIVFVAFVTGSVAGSLWGGTGGIIGLFGGAVLAFLVFSFVLYGR